MSLFRKRRTPFSPAAGADRTGGLHHLLARCRNWLGLALLLCFALSASAVEFSRVKLGGAHGLDGYLHVPAEAAGPRPAIVLMHGCGGLFGKGGELGARHRQWGDLLAEAGYVVLFVDSFSARGVRELCSRDKQTRTPRALDRAADAWLGHDFLAARSDVDPARISLLGWSHGGSSTLFALRARPSASPSGGRGFAAAVAFYPGCGTLSRQQPRYRPLAPVLLLIGERDDWTPAAPCRTLAGVVPEIELVVYPDAYHGFDGPGEGHQLRRDVPGAPNPEAGVTIARNPAARADAIERVSRFLAETLQ